MGLRPGALTQGKIDRTRSFWDKLIERPLAATTTYSQEGSCFVATSEAGNNQEVVAVSGGNAKEKFVGIGISDYRRITDFVACESCVVPTVGPFTFQLRYTTPVVSTYFVQRSDGVVLTNATGGALDAATKYQVSAGGLVTFHAGAAGVTISLIRYTWTPTMAQLDMIFHQRPYVAQGQSAVAQVALAQGYCEIYTTMYNSANTYALQDAVYTGADGKFTTTSTAVQVAGRVISLPSVSDVFLGVSYSVTPGAIQW